MRTPPTGVAKPLMSDLHVAEDDAVLLPFNRQPAAHLPANPGHPHAAQPQAGDAVAGQVALPGRILDGPHSESVGLGEVEPALGLVVAAVTAVFIGA